jgi:LysR family transcriptional regulator, mexEF-oprN operon transcriptional activator
VSNRWKGTLIIKHVDLARVDLKLLVAFDALLTEGSVTRAAERVGIGQPAMSHALARLRRLLRDELFVRAPDGVRPTPRALALADPIRVALSAIQDTLLQGQGFGPAEAERTFVLGMPDSVEIALLPRFLAQRPRRPRSACGSGRSTGSRCRSSSTGTGCTSPSPAC